MNQTIKTMVVLKLLNGMYQLTALNLKCDMSGAVLQPLRINAPVHSEERICEAVFYKKNKRCIMFFKELVDNSEKTLRFA